MGDFTNEEKERINQIYGNDFKNMSPDDVQLVIRWERAKAELETLQSESMRVLYQESIARQEQSIERHETAMDTLTALCNAAHEKYERAKNGEE